MTVYALVFLGGLAGSLHFVGMWRRDARSSEARDTRPHRSASPSQGFGAVAVATYLIGMLPIVFLTLWAVATGKFRDVERPKFRLLELDREIERGGEIGGSTHG